jgi:hypothetical protein
VPTLTRPDGAQKAEVRERWQAQLDCAAVLILALQVGLTSV